MNKKDFVIDVGRCGLVGMALGFFSGFAFFPVCPVNYPYWAALFGFPVAVFVHWFLPPSLGDLLVTIIASWSALGFLVMVALIFF